MSCTLITTRDSHPLNLRILKYIASDIVSINLDRAVMMLACFPYRNSSVDHKYG